MSFDQPQFWVAVLQIIWIDILLSGDNAVVIALACRSLPPAQRRWGIILGAGAAIVLRVIFAAIITTILLVPYLRLIGGVLLFWIALKLLFQDDEAHDNIAPADNLFRAVKTIVIADVVMSLDNVIAIAAAAKGSIGLLVFGLIVSIPLIVAGSALVMAMIDRFPVLVWAGAALLGWIAGEIMINDPAVLSVIDEAWVKRLHYWAALAGALFVIVAGYIMIQLRPPKPKIIEGAHTKRDSDLL